MRKLTPFVLAAMIILLAACQLVGAQSPADMAATQGAMTRIASAVNATQSVIDVKTAAAPTKAPTVERLTFNGVLLNGSVLNLVLGVWPLTPAESTIPNTDPLCLMQCIEELWITTDGRGTLSISLFEFGNEDQAVEKLREVRATQAILEIEELDLPEGIALPDGTWIQDNGSSGSRYTLFARQGRALAVLTLYLPDYAPSDNARFLALYAERQIQMLNDSGW